MPVGIGGGIRSYGPALADCLGDDIIYAKRTGNARWLFTRARYSHGLVGMWRMIESTERMCDSLDMAYDIADVLAGNVSDYGTIDPPTQEQLI